MSEQSIAQGAAIKRIPYGLADYGLDSVSDFAERDPDQAWFWTAEWQTAEREADENLRNGDYEDFDKIDDFIAA